MQPAALSSYAKVVKTPKIAAQAQKKYCGALHTGITV